jgi:hypothetical protein
VAVRFASSSRVKNDLPRYSNFWDGTTVFSPFTATGSYDALASYTVPSGGVSTITFAGLPTGGQYQHLQIRAILKTVANSNSDGNGIWRVNGDTGSNYSYHELQGNGSSASAGGAGSISAFTLGYTTGSGAGTSNIFAAYIFDILDYASTVKNKTVRHIDGYDLNGAEGSIWFRSDAWYNAASAINSITFSNTTNNFAQYSQISVYGIRG